MYLKLTAPGKFSRKKLIYIYSFCNNSPSLLEIMLKMEMEETN